jgi:hypothetical protein
MSVLGGLIRVSKVLKIEFLKAKHNSMFLSNFQVSKSLSPTLSIMLSIPSNQPSF